MKPTIIPREVEQSLMVLYAHAENAERCLQKHVTEMDAEPIKTLEERINASRKVKLQPYCALMDRTEQQIISHAIIAGIVVPSETKLAYSRNPSYALRGQ